MMTNEKLKQWAFSRFIIDESNEQDMKTLHLRGIHGTFKPENESENIECQAALMLGATPELPFRPEILAARKSLTN